MKRPLLDVDHVAQLLERQGFGLIGHDGDFLELPGTAWWICDIPTGTWKDATLSLEWDYRGWRWNLAYLVQDQSPADILPILPLSGTADVVTQALGQALLGESPVEKVDAMLDTLGTLPSGLDVEAGNVMAASSPRLGLILSQMLMDVSLSGQRLLALHAETPAGRCLTCAHIASYPCPTRVELNYILRHAPGAL